MKKHFLTKAEFADLAGVATNYLSNYIRRGDVILTGNLIDNESPKNKRFLDRRIAKSNIQDINLDELTNEYVFGPTDLGFGGDFEQAWISFNKEQDSEHKVIPVSLFQMYVAGSLIELAEGLMKREIGIRADQGLNIDKVRGIYLKLCKDIIIEAASSLREFEQEITQDKD